MFAEDPHSFADFGGPESYWEENHITVAPPGISEFVDPTVSLVSSGLRMQVSLFNVTQLGGRTAKNTNHPRKNTVIERTKLDLVVDTLGAVSFQTMDSNVKLELTAPWYAVAILGYIREDVDSTDPPESPMSPKWSAGPNSPPLSSSPTSSPEIPHRQSTGWMSPSSSVAPIENCTAVAILLELKGEPALAQFSRVNVEHSFIPFKIQEHWRTPQTVFIQ